MSLRSQNVQASHCLDSLVVGGDPHPFGGLAAQLDVRAAAGHVGRDGDRAHPTRLSDDLCLPLVVLGVQNVVGNPLAQGALQRLDHVGHSQELGEPGDDSRVEAVGLVSDRPAHGPQVAVLELVQGFEQDLLELLGLLADLFGLVLDLVEEHRGQCKPLKRGRLETRRKPLRHLDGACAHKGWLAPQVTS